MAEKEKTREELLVENEELKLRLLESEETLNAIQSGEVDALVVSGKDGDQIYSLEGADKAYRYLIEDMNEGAAILMYDGTIFYCNSRLADMVKVPLEDITGKSFDEFISPKDRFMYEALIKKGNSSGEISLQAKDGTNIPVYTSLNNLEMNDINGISLTVTDLTEQKRNEEIMESERLSRSIFEQANESIIFCNEKGFITHASEASHCLCECNPILEYFGNVFKLYNEYNEIFSIFSVLKGESIRHEELFLQKNDGNRTYLLLSARPVYNNKNEIIGCVTILTDINERKKNEIQIKNYLKESQKLNEELEVSNEELQATTEELHVSNDELHATTEELRQQSEKLKESEARYRSIIENVQDAYSRVDKEGIVIMASPSAARIYGFNSPKEMIGIPVLSIYKNPEDRNLLMEKLNSKGKVEDFESVALKKDGTSFPVSINAQLRYANGEIRGAEAFVRDITQRKQLEKELRQARDNLEEMVEERTIELEEAMNELKRSNKELQSFAYITSHDLQEPLRSIATYSQILERRYKGQLDEKADIYLDFMFAGAKRMKQQIQGLLDYSRVGTRGDEFKEFNASNALNSALLNLKSSIEESNAEIIFDELPVIYADENQIVRVFQNLIGNALKFHKEGVKPAISISAKNLRNETIFNIADNGIGIEDQYSEHIFEVFKRLHAIGAYEGAGIGLSITKRIIERHNGRIWVVSKFGIGSTFYFTIPNNKIK